MAEELGSQQGAGSGMGGHGVPSPSGTLHLTKPHKRTTGEILRRLPRLVAGQSGGKIGAEPATRPNRPQSRRAAGKIRRSTTLRTNQRIDLYAPQRLPVPQAAQRNPTNSSSHALPFFKGTKTPGTIGTRRRYTVPDLLAPLSDASIATSGPLDCHRPGRRDTHRWKDSAGYGGRQRCRATRVRIDRKRRQRHRIPGTA